MKSREIAVPSYIPASVPVNCLEANNMLYSDTDIDRLILAIKQDGVYKSVTSDGCVKHLAFPVIKINNQLFALYDKGDPVKGDLSVVRPAQCLQTGDWFAFKVRPLAMRYLRSMTSDMLAYGEQSKRKQLPEDIVFDNDNCHGMLLKYIKGIELFEIAKHSRCYSPGQLMVIAINLVEKVIRLNRKYGLLHRHLKPDNVIVDLVTNRVEIIGFSFSAVNTDSNMFIRAGIHDFLAPEALHYFDYSEYSEVYALGGIIAVLLTMGYQDVNQEKVVLFDDARFRGSRNYICNTQYRNNIHDFIAGMLAQDPKDRPSLDVSLTFFENILSLLPDSAVVQEVALIDVKDFDILCEAHRRGNKMRESLLGKDLVYLVDPDNMANMPTLARMKAKLESVGLVVADDVYQHDSVDVIKQDIQVKLDSREDGLLYHVELIKRPESHYSKLQDKVGLFARTCKEHVAHSAANLRQRLPHR